MQRFLFYLKKYFREVIISFLVIACCGLIYYNFLDKENLETNINENIELLDTPGILWPKFESEEVALNLAYTGSIKDDVIETIEIGFSLLKYLIKYNKVNLMQRYKLEESQVEEILKQDMEENEKALEIMDAIGRKRGAIVSGGIVDQEKVAKIILEDFRSAKLGKITLELPKAD